MPDDRRRGEDEADLRVPHKASVHSTYLGGRPTEEQTLQHMEHRFLGPSFGRGLSQNPHSGPFLLGCSQGAFQEGKRPIKAVRETAQ